MMGAVVVAVGGGSGSSYLGQCGGATGSKRLVLLICGLRPRRRR